ncbi:MAG: DUF4240 domain-containing protein [Hyphomicrobiaceae bacterium]
MTNEQFWSLIEQARGGLPESADSHRLTAVLRPLSNGEIAGFGLLFYEKICDLNDWRLWGAGYVIAGGMSDDSFHYFRSWIIGKGKRVFDLALTDPDSLGPDIDDRDVDNEALEYACLDLLEERGVTDDPRDNASRSADGDPSGTAFDEDKVAAAFPKLTALFG